MKTKTAKIYLITNLVNGKQYVGYTTTYVSTRWAKHVFYAEHKEYRNSRSAISCAINKYGKANFKVETIYQSKDLQHTLQTIEPYFIGLYNTYNYGYNLTLGGEGKLGRKKSEKCKEIHRLVHTGRKMSPESRQKCRLAKLKYWADKKRTQFQQIN